MIGSESSFSEQHCSDEIRLERDALDMCREIF